MPTRDYNKDPLTFDESWDLNAGIMVRQDFRDGGAKKLLDRLLRQMTEDQQGAFLREAHSRDSDSVVGVGDIVDAEQVRWNGYERQVKLRTNGLTRMQIVEEMVRKADNDESWSFNSGDLSRRDYEDLLTRLMKQVGTKRQKGEMP